MYDQSTLIARPVYVEVYERSSSIQGEKACCEGSLRAVLGACRDALACSSGVFFSILFVSWGRW